VSAEAKKPVRSIVDRALFAFVTRGWSKERITSYRARVRQHNEAMSDDVLRSFEQIDAKTTGLLTHVSLMIAGLGLITPIVADNDIEAGIIIAEIAAYLLLAVGCLRCLSIFHHRVFAHQDGLLEATVQSELIIRREIYSFCLRISIAFTLLSFFLLPILFLWKPEK
jgi:hypothetical protein